jgi:endonuclease/exonuclease/phosphatase (EEP) superfamily protein YafD
VLTVRTRRAVPPAARRAVVARTWVLAAACVAGALLAAALAGGLVGGRWGGADLGNGWVARLWWVTDLLAHFRVHYALAFLLLAAVLAAARVRTAALLCLAGALVAAAPLAPLYVAAPPAADEAAGLEIAFLNVRVDEAEPAAVADHLRESDADLVFLFTTTGELVEELRRADLPYHVAVARPLRAGVQLAPILLTRSPAIGTRVFVWGDHERLFAVEAAVEVDGRPVRVLGTHARSPQRPSRALLRDQNLAHVADWAARQTDPVVVVGDLNTTQWSHAFRDLVRRGGLVDSRRGFGRQASWPVPLGPLGLPIDHALHSADLVTVERSLGPGLGSQHRSVRLTVAPAPG